MVVEYWLEAEDNCDYPKPNVGRSKVYQVTLAAPQDPEDKKAAAEQAAADKQEHDQRQDQEHAKENEARKNQQQQAQGENPNAEQPPQANPQDKPQDNQSGNAREPNPDKAREALEKHEQRQRDRAQPFPGALDRTGDEPMAVAVSRAVGVRVRVVVRHTLRIGAVRKRIRRSGSLPRHVTRTA
jgi:hypothetical protein